MPPLHPFRSLRVALNSAIFTRQWWLWFTNLTPGGQFQRCMLALCSRIEFPPKTRYLCGYSVKHQVYLFQLHIWELITWPLDGSVDTVVILCTGSWDKITFMTCFQQVPIISEILGLSVLMSIWIHCSTVLNITKYSLSPSTLTLWRRHGEYLSNICIYFYWDSKVSLGPEIRQGIILFILLVFPSQDPSIHPASLLVVKG